MQAHFISETVVCWTHVPATWFTRAMDLPDSTVTKAISLTGEGLDQASGTRHYMDLFTYKLYCKTHKHIHIICINSHSWAYLCHCVIPDHPLSKHSFCLNPTTRGQIHTYTNYTWAEGAGSFLLDNDFHYEYCSILIFVSLLKPNPKKVGKQAHFHCFLSSLR